MSPDPQLVKRNVLVILGGLLAVYTLAYLVAAFLGSDGSAGARSLAVVVAAILGLVLGLALIIMGFVVFPLPRDRQGTDWLQPGTGTHFTFALLLSVTIGTLLWYIIMTVREQANDVEYVFGTTDVRIVTVALELFLFSLGALIPFWALVAHHWRMRRRCLDDLAAGLPHGGMGAGMASVAYTYPEPSSDPGPGRDDEDDSVVAPEYGLVQRPSA